MQILMRNIHLALGLAIVAMALMFALSSLFVIYRPWLPNEVSESEQIINVADGTPRTIALELMQKNGFKGDLLGIAENLEGLSFRISRPGTEYVVEYSRATGMAHVKIRKFQLGATLLQLHTTHGFWHEFAPAKFWALLSLLCSIGLLLLGASGVYLWFKLHQERAIGVVLLTFALGYGGITLLLTRLAA